MNRRRDGLGRTIDYPQTMRLLEMLGFKNISGSFGILYHRERIIEGIKVSDSVHFFNHLNGRYEYMAESGASIDGINQLESMGIKGNKIVEFDLARLNELSEALDGHFSCWVDSGVVNRARK